MATVVITTRIQVQLNLMSVSIEFFHLVWEPSRTKNNITVYCDMLNSSSKLMNKFYSLSSAP